MSDYETTKSWVRTRDTFAYLASDSGMSVEEGEAALAGAVSMLMDISHMSQNDAFRYLISCFPPKFRIECIPYPWLGMEKKPTAQMLEKITSFYDLWTGLPDEEKEPYPELYETLLNRYLYLVPMMLRYVDDAVKPEVKLYPFTKHGSQWIADWEVKDLTLKDDPSKRNWHLQNTSQWVFAGCLLVQQGSVSIHT